MADVLFFQIKIVSNIKTLFLFLQSMYSQCQHKTLVTHIKTTSATLSNKTH